MSDILEPNPSRETSPNTTESDIFLDASAGGETPTNSDKAEIVLSVEAETLPSSPLESESAIPMATLMTEAGSLPSVPVMPVSTPRSDGEHKAGNKRLIALFIRDEELLSLWNRASRAQKEVEAHINSRETADALFAHIELARNELIAGKENYEEAERHINEVEFRVALSQRVSRLSASLGVGLFAYETAWAVVLLLFLFLALGPAAFSSSAQASTAWMSPDVVFLLGSMTWGGLGGVIGAWLSLVKHTAIDQDFDRQHTLWYINSPVMGIGVGAVVYLVMRAGLLSITGPTEGINSPLIIYLLAWLSGFQQNVFTDLVRRLLQVFKIESSSEADEHLSGQASRTASEEHSGNGRA